MKKECLRWNGGCDYSPECPKVITPHVPVNLRPPVFWKAGDHDLRIQVHTPEHSRRLERVAGVRLIAYSVHGAYCRIYQMSKPPRWALAWIRRALLTNAMFGVLSAPQTGRTSGRVILQGGKP